MARKSARECIDIESLPQDIQKKLWEQHFQRQEHRLADVVRRANKYEAEMKRTDRLHKARLNKCRENFIQIIKYAADAFGPPTFTEWDLRMLEFGKINKTD